MKFTLFLFVLFSLIGSSFAQQSKLEKDREAIKAMAGCYKVTFDFAETFSPDTAYIYHDRYHSWGIEYVFVLEETDKKIALQHLLVVNDTMIIKHWRQDWLYENTELLTYHKNNEWIKKKISPQKAKGTWTQKVFQVDDGPRYEGYGTWNHVDGRHFWQSTADAPLPRREFSKRSDYNVLRRHSHFEILEDGWLFEQDNEKILREDGKDRLICWEKGIEKLTTGDYDCQPGKDWWEKNKQYWADVRKVWEEVYSTHDTLNLQIKIDDDILYMELFNLGYEFEDKKYNTKEAVSKIKKIINKHIVKK